MCPLRAPLGRVPLMWRHAYTMYCSFMFYIFFLLFLFTFCFVLFRVLRHSFSFLLREKGHTLNQATLGATRGGSDPPVVILIKKAASRPGCTVRCAHSVRAAAHIR